VIVVLSYLIGLILKIEQNRMYIVVIGWICVISMVAITESSMVAAVMIFTLYGVLPLSIFYT